MGKTEHEVHVVLDQQHGHIAGKRGDRGQKLAAIVLGDAGGRLIEQQQPRPAPDRERR